MIERLAEKISMGVDKIRQLRWANARLEAHNEQLKGENAQLKDELALAVQEKEAAERALRALKALKQDDELATVRRRKSSRLASKDAGWG